MYQNSSKIPIGIPTASSKIPLFRSELYNNSACALKQAFKKFVKLLTKKKITKDAHIEPYWKRCDVCRLKYEIIGKMETFDADSKVAGHLNPGHFNPKLRSGRFNPKLFEDDIFTNECFNHYFLTMNMTVLKFNGLKVHGLKAHGSKVYG